MVISAAGAGADVGSSVVVMETTGEVVCNGDAAAVVVGVEGGADELVTGGLVGPVGAGVEAGADVVDRARITSTVLLPKTADFFFRLQPAGLESTANGCSAIFNPPLLGYVSTGDNGTNSLGCMHAVRIFVVISLCRCDVDLSVDLAD